MRARLINSAAVGAIAGTTPPEPVGHDFDWIEIHAEHDGDPAARELLAALGLDNLATTYAMRTNVSGMFSEYAGQIVGTTWLAISDEPTPAELNFAWNDHRLITIRFGGDAQMDEVVNRVAASARTVFGEPDTAPFVILQLILASVNQQLTTLDLQLGELDSEIVEDAHPGQLGQLRTLRATVSPTVRRFPGYADALAAALIDPATLSALDSEALPHLQSYATHVKDTVARLNDFADGLRSAAQDYQTEIGNRQGNRINQLTIVSILFMPVTFLTGYFGMNFNWLDNNLNSLGSWLALGVLLPILVVIASAVALTRSGYILPRRRRHRQ